MLLAWQRPTVPLGRQELKLIFATGLMMTVNSLLMYAAIDHIPVGIAVAIGFWGPMALALHGSRHPIDHLWVGLAIGGILLFTPLTNASFDTTGVIFAILAGAGFGANLVIAAKLGIMMGGVPAAGMAMLTSTLMIAPFSIGAGLQDHVDAGLLGRMLLAAVLVCILGLALEYTALTRVRPSLYAILISLEPAVGAILGFLVLGETIGWLGAAGIGAVSVASIGASRTHRRSAT
jgi:inner membrane transporter RhtA